MSRLTILLLCIQACLIQNAFSACIGRAGISGPGLGAGVNGLAGLGGIGGAGCGAAYGGTGVGNVAVEGCLPVRGVTTLSGQVPIIGSVQFAGPVCASGAVSLVGSCDCGCRAPCGI